MENNAAYTEGSLTKLIEKQTSKISSTVFLMAALTAMATSATLKCFKQNNTALFIGQWAAPFLLLGIYNKIVKEEGHDIHDKKNS